jgi:uncharacterized protein involved in type VI secretion and phage assembly
VVAEGSMTDQERLGVVRVESNQQKIVKPLLALIAASAIVVMTALAVALKEEQTDSGTGTVATEAAGQMTLGATATTTTPPTAFPTPVAKPTMTATVPKGFR